MLDRVLFSKFFWPFLFLLLSGARVCCKENEPVEYRAWLYLLSLVHAPPFLCQPPHIVVSKAFPRFTSRQSPAMNNLLLPLVILIS